MRKGKLVKRIGLYLSATVIVFCIGFAIWFKANEKGLLYSPGLDSAIPEDNLHLKYEGVSIRSDGATLGCWIYPVQQPDSEMPWILYLPGNGGYDATDIARCKIFHELGLNVLAVRYRGCGTSTGKPNETGFYADATASYNFLRTVKGAAPADIVLYGHSLGSAIAIELASQVPAAGIAMEGASTSMAAVVGVHHPFIPWSLLISERYESIERINGITIPKIFVHASDDESVPISQARELYAKAVDPKTFVVLKGGHNHAPTADREKYSAALSSFLHAVLH